MNNVFKYSLTAGAALVMSMVSASADTTFADKAVTEDTTFKATNLSSAIVTSNNAADRTQIDAVLKNLGIDPNEVDVSNQSQIVDQDQLQQINANIPDWAKEIIDQGGQIGYLELEIYPSEAPAIYPPITPEPRIEKVYYQIENGVANSKTTQQILSQYGISADDLPPIGVQRWPLQAGQTLTLTYWTDPDATITTEDGSAKYADLVDQAINQWNNQLSSVNAPVKFVKAASEDQANYRFDLGNNSTVVAGQTLQGLSGRTTLYVDNSTNLYLDSYGIDTYINQNAISNSYTKTQTVNVIAHEIGHSMGLEHSKNSNDLMYSAPQNQTLSKNDAIAVLIMYTSENIPGKNSQQIFG